MSNLVGQNYILTLACDDRPGIVASVAGAVTECNGNIIESSQFGDLETARFFMRVKFASSPDCEKSQLIDKFSQVGESMTCSGGYMMQNISCAPLLWHQKQTIV